MWLPNKNPTVPSLVGDHEQNFTHEHNYPSQVASFYVCNKWNWP